MVKGDCCNRVSPIAELIRWRRTCHGASEVDHPILLIESGNSMVGVVAWVVVIRVDEGGAVEGGAVGEGTRGRGGDCAGW